MKLLSNTLLVFQFVFFILQLKATASPNVLFISVDDMNDRVGYLD